MKGGGKGGRSAGRRRPAPARGSPKPPPQQPAPRPLALRWAELALWVLFLATPLLVLSSAQESFRLPKLMAAEWLGLASLLALCFRLPAVATVRWADLVLAPALRAAAPIVVVALAGCVFGGARHPLHLHQALADLAIGAACLVGWSLGIEAERLQRLLDGLLWPAAILALIAILQFHGVYRPLRFLGVAADSRLAVTSLAGNPGALAAYLVLPCLIAQWRLPRRQTARGARRWAAAFALVLVVYALAATQTFSAIAAAALGTAILWGMRLPLRRQVAAAAAAGAAAGVVLLLVLALPPLRARIAAKGIEVRAGDWNAVLSGRLDGWRTAAFLLSEHPLAGVGQGAFRAEFAPAKLALLDRGVTFYPNQPNASFANAHNELLEVGADLGWPGLAALAWGIGLLWVALRRLQRLQRLPAGDGAEPRARAALAWAGTAALAVLSLAQFPFRIALVAFPWLLFLAWVFRAAGEAPAPGDAAAGAPA